MSAGAGAAAAPAAAAAPVAAAAAGHGGRPPVEARAIALPRSDGVFAVCCQVVLVRSGQIVRISVDSPSCRFVLLPAIDAAGGSNNTGTRLSQ